MKIRFNPYKNGCEGLKLLKEELKTRGYDAKEILTSGSRYTKLPGHLLINWGKPNNSYGDCINKNTGNASNKLVTLECLKSFNPIFFTVDKETAKIWTHHRPVYCRTNIYGSEGDGIVIASTPDEVVDAPLYTLRITGDTKEYRVHVFNNETIDYAQKKKMGSQRLEEEGIIQNPMIRNLANGYIFARDQVEVPEKVKEIAIKSISALTLNFGAVDIVWDGELAYVLEVNTAPGLTGTTVLRYADAIERCIS